MQRAGRHVNVSPCTSDPFIDVARDSPFCPYVKGMFGKMFCYFSYLCLAMKESGITSGCGGGRYCGSDSVTRGQMAVFLIRAFENSRSYSPPTNVPKARFSSRHTLVPHSSQIFKDTDGHSFQWWAEEMYRRGYSSGSSAGCAPRDKCLNDPRSCDCHYGINSVVTRGQMAVYATTKSSCPALIFDLVS